MPEVLDTPPAKVIGIPFNSAKASLAGQRSGQVRRLQAAILARKPIDLTPLQPANLVERTTNAQLDLVAEQIAHTRTLLNDKRSNWCPACERGGMEPHHRAQLLKALDTLLDRQRKLLGIGDPAPRKAERNSRVSAGWIELQPALPGAPVAPAPTDVTCCAPARPPGWEYQDPPGYVREPVTGPSPPKTD